MDSGRSWISLRSRATSGWKALWDWSCEKFSLLYYIFLIAYYNKDRFVKWIATTSLAALKLAWTCCSIANVLYLLTSSWSVVINIPLVWCVLALNLECEQWIIFLMATIIGYLLHFLSTSIKIVRALNVLFVPGYLPKILRILLGFGITYYISHDKISNNVDVAFNSIVCCTNKLQFAAENKTEAIKNQTLFELNEGFRAANEFSQSVQESINPMIYTLNDALNGFESGLEGIANAKESCLSTQSAVKSICVLFDGAFTYLIYKPCGFFENLFSSTEYCKALLVATEGCVKLSHSAISSTCSVFDEASSLKDKIEHLRANTIPLLKSDFIIDLALKQNFNSSFKNDSLNVYKIELTKIFMSNKDKLDNMKVLWGYLAIYTLLFTTCSHLWKISLYLRGKDLSLKKKSWLAYMFSEIAVHVCFIVIVAIIDYALYKGATAFEEVMKMTPLKMDFGFNFGVINNSGRIGKGVINLLFKSFNAAKSFSLDVDFSDCFTRTVVEPSMIAYIATFGIACLGFLSFKIDRFFQRYQADLISFVYTTKNGALLFLEY